MNRTAVGLTGLAAGLIIGLTGGMAADQRPTTAPVPSRVTVTATPQPQTQAAPAGLPDGSYVVGVDVQAGTYQTVNATSFCYADTKDIDGTILKQEVSDSGSAIITVEAGAFTFKSSGCGTWQKV